MGSKRAEASFGKAKRLLNAKDYSEVFDGTEAKASHKRLLLLAKRNNTSGHRLGLVIARKNVRLAVERNRIKRVAREFFRTLKKEEPGMDVVLLARHGMDQLDNAELSSILRQQWQVLGRRIPKTESNSSRDS